MPKGVEHYWLAVLRLVAQLRVESLMPKGVEHGKLRTPSDIARCVESLMPKGVEHIESGKPVGKYFNVLNL